MTGLLRIQVTDLLWDIHQRVNLFLMTFLLTLLILTAPATDLNWDLLTGSIAHKLSRGLLNVLENNGAGRGELTRSGSPWWCSLTQRQSDTAGVPGRYRPSSAVCSTSLSCSSLPPVYTRRIVQRKVRPSYKPEGDLTVFLEVLAALLLLGGIELSDVGEVALLYVLVDTLQDWLLGQGLDGLFLNINISI